MRSATPLRTWSSTTPGRRSARSWDELDAPVDRARMHHDGVVLGEAELGAVDAEGRGVLADAGEEGALEALLLDAQHHHHVGSVEGLTQARDHLDAERLDAQRDHGGRRRDPDLGTQLLEAEDVGAGDPRVQHVADDRHGEPVDASLLLEHRQQVEERLGRVLVGPVAGVDHRRGELVRDALGNARHLVAHDDDVGVHGVEGLRGVEDRLGLRHARGRGREVHDVRREALAGDLEARARARRGLEEQVDQGAAAQGRHLLDLAASDLLHVPGRLEDALDLVALQVLDAEEIAPLHRPSPSSDSTTTSSGPSRVPSWPRTTTRSRRDVGMFFPT